MSDAETKGGISLGLFGEQIDLDVHYAFPKINGCYLYYEYFARKGRMHMMPLTIVMQYIYHQSTTMLILRSSKYILIEVGPCKMY